MMDIADHVAAISNALGRERYLTEAELQTVEHALSTAVNEALSEIAEIEHTASNYLRYAPDAEIGREQLVAVLMKIRFAVEAAKLL